MDNSWLKTTLGELCDRGQAMIQTGPFGSQLHSYDYQTAGVPVVPTEAIGRRRIRGDAIPRVSEAVVNRLARHKLRAGDILFARRGAQATGLSALVESKHEGWLCGTGAILMRLETPDVDPTFLSFALSSEAAIRWLKTHAVGAVMPNLNEGVLRRLPLLLPPPKHQRGIAHILSTLDDKIELNRQMNGTVEAMAQALFKSWFVESTQNGLPEGWRAGTLGDVAENMRRTVAPEQSDPSTPYIGLEHMPRRCIALSEWETSEALESNKFAFRCGEILFGKLRPYFHKVGVAPIDGACSTDILVIGAKEPEWFGFVLGHISSVDLVNHTDAASTGTKMPRTNWQDIARFEIALPPRSLAAAFTRRLGPLIDRIIANIHESRTLAELRDALLPKLLSGKLRVKSLET